MLSVSSSSSTRMIGRPLDEAMAMYSFSMDHGFYDHYKQELPTGVMDYNVDDVGNSAQVGDRGNERKVSHNASERHRRKKINELYSSLRSLLPASEQSSRMSIPMTVAKVLKYIPELQDEVEKMEKNKQTISRKIHQNQEQVRINSPSFKPGRSEHYYTQENNEGEKQNTTQKKYNVTNVSTSKVSENEVVIQVSSSGISIPEIVMSLEEEDGFQLISSFSCSDSFGGRFFLNLHLQKPFGVEKMECEGLDQKVLSMLENEVIVSRHY